MAWGPWQILLVLAIILVLFGGKKLPELAHSLGKSLGEFKKGKEEGDRETAKPELAKDKAAEPQKLGEQKTVSPATAG